MEAAFLAEFGLESELIASRGGILEIDIDGQIAYSNNRSGYQPTVEEGLKALRPYV